jgi:aspartyl-tRNA(Asn)/glutamyl-tRNA(Gln) amidotransferase subunit A
MNPVTDNPSDVRPDMTSATMESVAKDLRSGQLSPVELVEAALARIELAEPSINALVEVYAEDAREAARGAAAEIAAGHHLGPLHGVPVAVKDLFDVEGFATTASSKVRANHVASGDARVVALLRRAGAIPIAKAHTHEFAYGGITPQTCNPWDVQRIPGGSSGGTAAAIASGEALVGLGTDTAGSIRIPSSCCGIVGLKPTFGRVSRRGVVPLSWSLDHVGPMARTVRDVAIVLQAIAGHDPMDSMSAREAVPVYLATIEDGVADLRIGVPENYYFEHCTNAVETSVREVARELERQGARLIPFRVPMVDTYSPVEFCIVMAEASEYHRETMLTSAALYGDHTRAMLLAGESILATDYIHSLRLRARIAQAWREAFADVDVVLAPSLPDVAARIGEVETQWDDGTVEELDNSLTRLNCPQNLTGLPALSLRCGFDHGVPIGAQFIGRTFDEATVLRVARVVEKAIGPWDKGPFPTGFMDR